MDLKEILALVTRSPVDEHATFDSGRKKARPALSTRVARADARAFVREVRAQLPPRFVCFVGTTRWLGPERHEGQAELVVAPARSPFDALRLARCAQAAGLEALLREWDPEFGVDLWHAETTEIEFDLARPPGDPRAAVERLLALAPGAEVSVLAEGLARGAVSLRLD